MPAQTENTPTPPAILAAVRAVMEQVTFVPKAGQYRSGKGANAVEYAFRRFEDTAAALSDAFRQHGIFVQSEVLAREVGETDKKPYSQGSGYTAWTSVFVTMRYTFTSLVDGSTLSVGAIGEGKDSSDKSSAKAMTMAMKSALTQGFMIATDEKDPDAERPGDYAPPVGQGFDPNEGARQRQQAERQRAAAQGVNPPAGGGTPEEKRERHAQWVATEIRNPELTLERLAYIHLITGQRSMLGYDVQGVPLGTRIAAELARFGLEPNGAMPTPEQARNRAQASQGGA